jgi:HEAT repeat protein
LLVEIGEKPPFLRDIPVTALLDAKIQTAELLAALGESPSDEAIEADAARSVFAALTSEASEDRKRASISLLETPESVRHLVAMLTQYDYDLLEHADSIRQRLIAALLEDCDDPDPRVRLKAIEMTGKIKEIGLFEERVTIKRETLSDSELDSKIRERMERLRQLTLPAAALEPPIDITPTERSTQNEQETES